MKPIKSENEYKKALIYCRVSSERQVKDGSGLDSQEQRCVKYAKDKGLVVSEIFRDEGISGGLFDRPAMKSLLSYLDKHNKENYVVYEDDICRWNFVMQNTANWRCLKFMLMVEMAGVKPASRTN